MKFMIRFFVSLLLSFGWILSATASEAQALLGTCDYYEARSDELNCDANGYLKSFGEYYCRRFEAAHPHFTSQGQVVLDKIKICLQKSLEGDNQLSCNNVLSRAAESHVPCYVGSGFCQMGFWDKWVLGTIVAPALQDPVLRSSIERIELRCAGLK